MRDIYEFTERELKNIAASSCKSNLGDVMAATMYWCVCFIILMFTTGSRAATIHVPDEYTTIQDGIDASVDGDTVLVADGTYYGEGNRFIRYKSKAITVMSENGPESTVIDCERESAGFYFFFDDLEARLEGITIQNGEDSSSGGGIYCSSGSPVIANCIITNNSVPGGYDSRGGGICCLAESSPIIMDCIISGNYSDDLGGGLYCDSTPTVMNSIFIGNFSWGYGGGICCTDSIWITNCLIIENSNNAFGAGLFSWWANPVIEQCTIAYNFTTDGGGGVSGQDMVIANSILWGNSPDEIYGDVSITYSNIQGGWEGEGNIDTDPIFVSYRGFDYLLHPSSSCIDTGDPSIEDRLYDWHPKWPGWYPNGARSDMGTYGGPGNWKWLK